ncbi:uncharacterized protein [Typha latifolia]|uniref:uncharacterized protein isoform X2 n=1 Tax=Typha latifolia TaxID=4733 RepID=UPI003C2CF814
MAKRSVRYAVIDAFTDAAFKGNPAAVCFLEAEGGVVDEQWMQSVAKEFNISDTAFLSRATSAVNSDAGGGDPPSPRFHLRWFTPVSEVNLCGHATLAAAHFLLISGLVKCDTMEFLTKSGVLTAKKVLGLKHLGTSNFSLSEGEEKFSIELDFPLIPVVDCNSLETPSIPETLNDASIVNMCKTATDGDLIVELASGKEVADINPNFTELKECPGRGVIITGQAPAGSGFDFFSRFFCPKLGVNEDPVCGSAHCALAPYWGKKLEKQCLIAYMASPRGGRLDLQLVEETQRVRIKGEAVTIMNQMATFIVHPKIQIVQF